MVTPNQTPPAEAPGAPDLLKALGLDAPPPRHPPTVEMRDDPRTVATYARCAQAAADSISQKTNCGCPICKLTIFEARAAAFMQQETIRAAFTGDTSRLEAVVRLIDELKGGFPPPA